MSTIDANGVLCLLDAEARLEEFMSIITPSDIDEMTEQGLTTDELLHGLNLGMSTATVHDGDIDGLPWESEWLYVKQNNPFHMEGVLYMHVILMLGCLKVLRKSLGQKAVHILERAIFWSDLGKFHTTKPGKKTWEDGTAISTAFGHDKKSAELLDEAVSILKVAPWWYKPVRWIVANHMKAHSIGVECDEKGRDAIPEWLQPQVEGLEPWDWPEFAELDIPHGANFSKKDLLWTNLGASKLLRIKQLCDEHGRISDENLTK